MTKTSNNIEILRCDEVKELASIDYGFFTRNGGVSAAPYDSLNVGVGSDDNQDHVQMNRQRAMEAFANKNASDLCTLHQIHSNHVVKIDVAFTPNERPQGDAMVTNVAGVVLGILTADCGPILFADTKNKVIGGAHAGWKGALYGVLENTIKAMEEIGAQRSHITAMIGPCIHQPSYEVGSEFREAFLKESETYQSFFNASELKPDHYHFDLPGFICARLQKQDLAAIHQVKLDTCKEASLFFSYRRNTLHKIEGYGRGLSAIMLRD